MNTLSHSIVATALSLGAVTATSAQTGPRDAEGVDFSPPAATSAESPIISKGEYQFNQPSRSSIGFKMAANQQRVLSLVVENQQDIFSRAIAGAAVDVGLCPVQKNTEPSQCLSASYTLKNLGVSYTLDNPLMERSANMTEVLQNAQTDKARHTAFRRNRDNFAVVYRSEGFTLQALPGVMAAKYQISTNTRVMAIIKKNEFLLGVRSDF